MLLQSVFEETSHCLILILDSLRLKIFEYTLEKKIDLKEISEQTGIMTANFSNMIEAIL